MKNMILKEMENCNADGVEFVPIFSDYSKPYKIILNITKKDIEDDKLGACPKTGRRYYKIINNKKIYIK